MQVIDNSNPAERLYAQFKRFRDGGLGTMIWLLVAFVLTIIVSLTTFTVIEPGQVAVRVNNVTGGLDTIVRPGLVTKLPFGMSSVHVIDASPQTFVMRGDKSIDELHVPELTVRASDGSNFLFNDTSLIFQVLGDQAQDVIRDAGAKDSFRRWMRPTARSVLRDEFGRESTISVSNPASFGAATERARTRLNELLQEHGVTVTQVVTPRPRFSEEYENMIEARNEAENQLAVITSELARAETDRRRRLAEVERDQNHVIQQKRAELVAALATAVTEQAETIREVDTYRIQAVSQGQAAKSAAQRKAEELEGQLEAEYASQKASIDAFRTNPAERVMERLGSKLEGVTISIQPWASDATPSRVQLEQLGGGR